MPVKAPYFVTILNFESSFKKQSQNQFSRNTLHSCLALVSAGTVSRKDAKKGVKQSAGSCFPLRLRGFARDRL
jgi:hypothetical protein